MCCSAWSRRAVLNADSDSDQRPYPLLVTAPYTRREHDGTNTKTMTTKSPHPIREGARQERRRPHALSSTCATPDWRAGRQAGRAGSQQPLPSRALAPHDVEGTQGASLSHWGSSLNPARSVLTIGV